MNRRRPRRTPAVGAVRVAASDEARQECAAMVSEGVRGVRPAANAAH